jgi:hypothetical protein
MNARFFGETPVHTFNAATGLITVGGKGTATIVCITDVVLSTLTFRSLIAGSNSLNGTTFVAGSIIYGVATYTVASGTGIAYHSMPKDP